MVAVDDIFIEKDINLALLTSWHIGGRAKYFFTPKDTTELSKLLKLMQTSIPILFLGLGSNMLIRDGGFPGLVCHMHRFEDKIEISNQFYISPEKILCCVGVGVSCAKLAKFAHRENLANAAFFAGIPGTVGGALAMNAGAFGGQTWEHVYAVEVLDRGGQKYLLRPIDFEIGYRSVRSKKNQEIVFTKAYFAFLPRRNSKKEECDSIKALLQQRNATQPIGAYSCGSVFKNPPNQYSTKLIEKSKLKGMRIGNAMVSYKHANFILNLGGAKASEVEALITHIQIRVKQDHGISLIPEVKIVGIR